MRTILLSNLPHAQNNTEDKQEKKRGKKKGGGTFGKSIVDKWLQLVMLVINENGWHLRWDDEQWQQRPENHIIAHYAFNTNAKYSKTIKRQHYKNYLVEFYYLGNRVRLTLQAGTHVHTYHNTNKQ